jgi:hypothetical protein
MEPGTGSAAPLFRPASAKEGKQAALFASAGRDAITDYIYNTEFVMFSSKHSLDAPPFFLPFFPGFFSRFFFMSAYQPLIPPTGSASSYTKVYI